ncbi:MAG: hypothetical protein QW450_00210 [Candidatus Nitrosocaldus sp.]
MEYVTVSAKIPKRLKDMLDKYGIRPGPVIRRALEEEVKRALIKEVEGEISTVRDALAKISDEEIVRLIREDREAR